MTEQDFITWLRQAQCRMGDILRLGVIDFHLVKRERVWPGDHTFLPLFPLIEN